MLQKPFPHAALNRRRALAALGGAAIAARNALSQEPGTGAPPERVTPDVVASEAKPGARPALCVYSGCLSKIPYSELSGIVRDMGYDGVDLTVMKGGHVDPSRYMVDLDRAFQTFQDAGLDLPMVTTDFTSASQPYAYAVLYVSAELGARFLRLGTWQRPAEAPDPTGQLATLRRMTVRNDLSQFAITGMRCKILPLLANHAGSYPGRSIPEAESLLGGIAPTAFGYCFDPAQAVIEAGSADAWMTALQAALPRLGAVALSDVALDRTSSPAQARACPLGEGAIDWKKFFATLAGARFHGPVSMHMDYHAPNDVNAMTKDLAFARARIAEAWPR